MDGLSETSHLISGISVFANLYLLNVYISCPLTTVKSYKYFFLLMAFQDLLHSTCMISLVPVVVISHNAYVFATTGPLSEHFLGYLVLKLYPAVFIQSLLLLANSFIYRNLKICRPRLFEKYSSTLGATIVVIINLFLIVNWVTTSTLVYSPIASVAARLREPVKMLTGADLLKCAYVGISMERSAGSPLKRIFSTEMQLTQLLLGVIMVFCALRIRTMLKKATFSEHLMKMHRQLFTLLLLQTACPLLLLHTQTFVTYGLIYAGATSPKFLMYITSLALSTYPLVNPIIVIGFVSEYRKRTLDILRTKPRRGINDSSAVSVVVVSNFGTPSSTSKNP